MTCAEEWTNSYQNIVNQSTDTLNMAPMIRQDTAELIDECLGLDLMQHNIALDFDEISNLATSEDMHFDNTKLMEDNCVDVSQVPVTPQLAFPDALDSEFFIDADSQAASSDLFVMQPASLVSQPQFLDYELSCDIGDQPSPSAEFVVMQALNPESCNAQVQPAFPEHQYQSEESCCLTPTASPADSYVLTPSPMMQEEPASPNPQQPADAPKKRGRKRKYPEGMAPSRRRPRKPKVYEMGPLPDQHLEKKRLNALNAKKHRDLQKQAKQELTIQLELAKSERDRLQLTVNQYKQREQQLLQLLNQHGIAIAGLVEL